MIRTIFGLLLTVVWFVVAISALVSGIVWASLTLSPCILPLNTGLECGFVEAFVHEELFLERLPLNVLNVYLDVIPIGLMLIGMSALLVVWQILDLNITRRQPGQSTLAVGYAAFFVLMIVFIQVIINADIRERLDVINASLCPQAEVQPADADNVIYECDDFQFRPPADPNHVFFDVIDTRNLGQIQRLLTVLAAIVAGLSIPFFFEAPTPPIQIRRQLLKSDRDHVCNRCGVVFSAGQIPACILCKHSFELVTPNFSGQSFGIGVQVPVTLRIEPDKDIPVRDLALSMSLGSVFEFVDYKSNLEWTQPSGRGRRVGVALNGPEVINEPCDLTLYIRVMRTRGQLRRKRGYLLKISISGSEYNTWSEEKNITVPVMRNLFLYERMFNWIIRQPIRLIRLIRSRLNRVSQVEGAD